MAFVINFAKTIRNHWKKSAFAAGVITYGCSYGYDKYQIHVLMRKYCEEAAKYGDEIQNFTLPHKRILVVLNPVANKRSAEKIFEKYCGPLLHLSGCLVDVVKTDSVGHGCRIVEDLEKLPDAIVVAGGDGTVSETITGYLRRQKYEQCPIGILPLGRTNSIAKKTFSFKPFPNRVEHADELAQSAMSIVRGKLGHKNVMKIEPMHNDTETESKPIYAAGCIQWGAFRDVIALRDKYWYFGSLREYVAAFFNAFSSKLTWQCNAEIIYTPPCSGCNNCYVKKSVQINKPPTHWWSKFIPKVGIKSQFTVQNQGIDYSKVLNENCTKEYNTSIDAVEMILSPSGDASQRPELIMTRGKSDLGGFEFFLESWERSRTGKSPEGEQFSARTLQLKPLETSTPENERFYSIDNEPFEVLPIKISIVPHAINLYMI